MRFGGRERYQSPGERKLKRRELTKKKEIDW